MLRNISIIKRGFSSIKKQTYYSKYLGSYEDWSKVTIIPESNNINNNLKKKYKKPNYVFNDKFNEKNWYAKLLFSFETNIKNV